MAYRVPISATGKDARLGSTSAAAEVFASDRSGTPTANAAFPLS